MLALAGARCILNQASLAACSAEALRTNSHLSHEIKHTVICITYAHQTREQEEKLKLKETDDHIIKRCKRILERCLIFETLTKQA